MYADETMIPISDKRLKFVYEEICKHTQQQEIRQSAYWYIYNRIKGDPTFEVSTDFIYKVVRIKLGYREDFSAYG